MDHGGAMTEPSLHLLKHGRHLRLTPTAKLIVGRTRQDNENILRYLDPKSDTQIKVLGYPGPIALIPGGGTDPDTLARAAAMVAGYSKAPAGVPANVAVRQKENQQTLAVTPLAPAQNRDLLI